LRDEEVAETLESRELLFRDEWEWVFADGLDSEVV
jgi:hypothetical protein